MIRRRDLRLDACLVGRVVLHDGRAIVVTASPSARRAYVDGPGIVALDLRELGGLLAALDDAADVLAEEQGDG